MPRVATSSGSWIPYYRYREAADFVWDARPCQTCEIQRISLSKMLWELCKYPLGTFAPDSMQPQSRIFLSSRRKIFLFCCTVSGKRHTYTRCHHQLQAAQARCAKSVQPIAPRVRRRLPPKRVANYQKGVCLQNLIVPKLVARHRG